MKIIVSLSGGLDSAVALSMAIQQSQGLNEWGGPRDNLSPESLSTKIVALNVAYGSKHNVYERAMAQRLADHFGVGYEQVDLPIGELLRSDLLRSGGDIPEGHYSDASMARTVVPGRNLIFIALAAAMAESFLAPGEYGTVVLGTHLGDHAIYPDCRPAFIGAAAAAVGQSSEHRVEVWAPLMSMDKTAIVAAGIANKVPLHLTRTCYKDQAIACGRCGSCNERLEAFRNNSAIDPLPYESNPDMPPAELAPHKGILGHRSKQ